jgi:acetyltransferase-like isoleucine patch superfamily enzyme
MSLLIRVASKIRRIWRQALLYRKYSPQNKIGRNVKFSQDTIMGKNCIIGNNVTIGECVKLGNGISIGNSLYLERITIGDDCIIEGKAIITGNPAGHITIGNHSFIGHNTVLDFSDDITIGNFVHIGYSHFWTHTSAMQALNGIPLHNKDIKYRPTAPILIEDYVYVGVQSVIYPGVKIGHHSIITPNSVVTKDVLPYTMVGGTPAAFIKEIKL